MNIRELMTKLDSINEAAPDANAYRRAQVAMANLEKAADYVGGTDPIVRGRYGLPPPLPPIDQWDGKMPMPVGHPDWMTRNIFGRGADEKIQAGSSQNEADAASIADAKAKLVKLNNLISKLKPANTTTTPVATPVATPSEVATNAIAGATPKLGALGSGTYGINEGNLFSDSLIESFGYNNESIASTGAKMIGKALPGVGLAFGAADAYDRAKKGDWLGAGMAGLAGVTSLVPGVGTAASLGLDAANLARDYKAGEFGDKTASAAPSGTTKGDPKVFALQQALIKKGAKITADGIMGPLTQAAIKQFGAPTVAEGIASLRDRLAMLETEQADEGVLSNIWQGAKNIGRAAKIGATGEKVINPATGKEISQAGKIFQKAVAGQSPATKAAYKTGQWVGKNPNKTVAGATALGAAAGYGLGKDGPRDASTASGAAHRGAGGMPTTGSADANSAAITTPVDQETLDQIDLLMTDLALVSDPEIQQGLEAAKAEMAKITNKVAAPTQN